MINVARTVELFGYSPESLTRCSTKKLAVTCDQCSREYEVIKGNYTKFVTESGQVFCKNCRASRARATCLRKYGVANPMQAPLIQEKYKRVCREKFGTDFPLQNKTVQKKTQETSLERYGSKTPFESPSIQTKVKKTFEGRYGGPTPMRCKVVRDKVSSAVMLKYGVPFAVNTAAAKDACRNANHVNRASIQLLRQATCMARYGTPGPPNNRFGKAQSEIGEWLQEISGKPFLPDRTVLRGKELDMYNAESRLAVEYCGLYWHNEYSPSPRGRHYHHDKLIRCQEQGIRLITIFEDEWLLKQDQVKGFLTSVLGGGRRVHGRHCLAAPVDGNTAKEFIDKHHIQGSTRNSKYCVGLTHKEDGLVGVMTFGCHPRNAKKLVLDRMCFLPGLSVNGGASKMFKFSVSNWNISEVISWSDNRWSLGNVYQKMGFSRSAALPPDYSYVDGKTRLSKQSQKKKSTKCPESLTELAWATTRGLHRIWDCGKIRWDWKNKL